MPTTASLLFSAVLLATPPGPQQDQGGNCPFRSEEKTTTAGLDSERISRRIDQIVFGQLEARGIQPARPSSDAVFLRRVYLDVLGTLPTPREAREFLADTSPEKRRVLIDRLLERDEYADYWAMKWSDLLRVKAEFPINLWPNAVQAYHHWIRASLRENVPYDRFARELLTASGSNFRVPQVNFYRALRSKKPEAIAEAVALTFMGVQTKNWSCEQRVGLAGFFSYIGYKRSTEWKEEIIFHDAVRAAEDAGSGTMPRAVLPDGSSVPLAPQNDPRAAFADWLVSPGNPWFARNIVNRIWYWLQGRGIIHQPDDIRLENPPSLPELLAFLESELVRVDFDLKQIFRLILNSGTYQLSSIPESDHPDAERLFAFYPLRQLDAEVLIDALCQITGSTEQYSSAIPEPFTFLPEDCRSIALADGSITSPFLELFGRPPRDTGFLSERSLRPTAAQRLHLLNSSHIQRKIERSQKLRTWIGANEKRDDSARRIYLAILSRFPTEHELEVVQEYRESANVNDREAAIDLAWALINSAEFLFRH